MERYHFIDGELSKDTVIIDDIPGGTTHDGGRMAFGHDSLLYEAVLSGTEVVEVKCHLQDEYGRLRNVLVGPEGYFYLLTSNRDGRGSPIPDDDKIIRINSYLD